MIVDDIWGVNLGAGSRAGNPSLSMRRATAKMEVAAAEDEATFNEATGRKSRADAGQVSVDMIIIVPPSPKVLRVGKKYEIVTQHLIRVDNKSNQVVEGNAQFEWVIPRVYTVRRAEQLAIKRGSQYAGKFGVGGQQWRFEFPAAGEYDLVVTSYFWGHLKSEAAKLVVIAKDR